MAENGRREVVGDPLALNPASQMADRSLATIGVRNPGKSGGQDAVYQERMGLLDAMGGLATAVNKVIEQKSDEWMTEGKLAYMQGVTEEEINKSGNKYTQQGWQSMAAVESANNWYATELTNISNGADRMDPGSYGKMMMQRRADFLSNLPDDPAIKKIYAAAFDDLGSRLTMQHTEAHNKYNIEQTENSFVGMVTSGAKSNADVSRVVPGGTPLAMSGEVVRQTVQYNDNDVDVLTRTILGEAGGEGPTGMAAVAHVIVNRAIDGGYGGKSIAGVAKSPQQFSTWNKGAGGNNPGRFDPGSQGYQQARNIAMAVLSGHHIDPTNGATHFFSQVGMDKLVRDGHQTNRTPAWWNDQVGRSGGSITIGRHQFAGRANGAAPFTGGRNLARGGGVLKFRHAGQEALDGTFSGILVDASNALGRDLTITSGYRSPERNASVGGAGQSRHMHGDAADIDMKGMSPNERAELVQTLRAKGVLRFGTYDNEPDMLHVDMGTAGGNGGNWFMHNKSNGNMAKAPEWFKQVAASPTPTIDPNVTTGPGASAAPGQPVNATSSLQYDPYTGPSTSTMESIRSDPMPGPRKGELLGQAMFTELQGGDDSTFREAGGIGMLQELGAPQSVIRQVQAARQAYEKEQLNKFDADKLKWENDLTLKVGAGELSADDALNQINARHQQNSMTDEQAKSLAARVLQQSAMRGKAPNMSYEVMNSMASIFASVNARTLDPKDADAQIRELAQVHDIPEQQLNGFISRMWQENEQGLNAQRTAVANAEKKRLEQEERKDIVRSVLSRGMGLSALSNVGEIEGVDDNGVTRSMSAQQWGIQQIKQDAIAAGRAALDEAAQGDPMQVAKADANATMEAFRTLRRHGVVDNITKGDLTGALTGNILTADGKPNPQAVKAFDFYLQMIRDPDVGDAYMAQYFGDIEAKNLAENAALLFNDAEFGLELSLQRSAEALDPSKFTPQQKINADVRFNTVVSEEVDKNIAAVTNGENGWLAWLGVTSYQTSISTEEREAALDNNEQLRQMIETRARVYHAQYPQNRAEVSIRRATTDVLRNATIVGGNMLMPMNSRAPSVQDAMGLQGEDRDLPNKLITDYVFEAWNNDLKLRAETGQDQHGWGVVEMKLAGRGDSFARSTFERARRNGKSFSEFRESYPEASLPFQAEYLPEAGVIRVVPFKDGNRGEGADVQPLLIPLAQLGADFRAQSVLASEQNQANPFQRMMNTATDWWNQE